MRVIVPKGKVADTGVMNHDPRPHVHRRRLAIDRLRSLTTGAALAGLAGTVGFGALAAISWSGTTTSDSGTTTDSGTGLAAPTPTRGTTAAGGAGTGSTGTRVVPNAGVSAPQPTATPRVQRGSGSGHASSGGSH